MEAAQALGVGNLFNVEDWVCVVTGGGTGIGLMIAQTLAHNGAKVYITGRREEVLKNTVETHQKDVSHEKGQLIPLTADVSHKEGIKKLRDAIAEREKHIDLLVNNAGINGASLDMDKGEKSAQALSDELWKDDETEWEDIYRTNVIGHYFTSVAFLPLLSQATTSKKGHSASVVNITSISGIVKVSQGHPSYNVSKGAAVHLTHVLAHEFSRPGVKVRVNSVAPGIFPSEMTAGDSNDRNKSKLDEQKLDVPAGRAGHEHDMGQAVLSLAVNQYINGQTLAVDGGYLLRHPS